MTAPLSQSPSHPIIRRYSLRELQSQDVDHQGALAAFMPTIKTHDYVYALAFDYLGNRSALDWVID